MKLFYYKDPNKPLCYFNTDKQVIIPDTYKSKKLRALWVSNVVNIDMPTTENIEVYENKALEIISTCKAYNINTIFFQVRTTNDAFYESKLNPYSRYYTGKEGKKPPYDCFKWLLELAKKANIEVHGWCNPYRISSIKNMTIDEYLETCDDLNFAKRNKDVICLANDGKLILNPAKEEVKQFIVDSMIELATNYDVAGVHFDDYFYPYEGFKEGADDLEEFEKRSDKNENLGDFRRRQITDVIKRVHKAIKPLGKQFGVSPFGIWMNKESNPLGSNTDSKCSQSFDNQYADSYLWVKEGYIDYIVPQCYWDFGHKLAPFADLILWWVNLCKGTDVDLYIGHGAYRLGTEDTEYANPMEVANQLKYANQYNEVKGNIFFTYKTFIDKEKCMEGMKEVKKLLNCK